MNIHRTMILCAMLALLGGCSSGKPISMWQKGLENYVATQGNGDMNVLRESPSGGGGDGPQRKFGVLDGDHNEAQGVLLGFRPAPAATADANRRWYLYLVGVTKNRDVQDIHMMAVSQSTAGNKSVFDWAQAGPDPTATSRYRSAQLSEWQKNNPNAKGDEGFEMTFPGPDDVFSLSMAGNTATATDQRSGAKWTLVFNEAPATGKPTTK